MRSGARGNVCTERRRGEPETRGAAGQREGAEDEAEDHTPSVLVQKETTGEAKLRHRGLPHTNNNM